MTGMKGEKVPVDLLTGIFDGKRYIRMYDDKRSLKVFRIRVVSGKDSNGNRTYTEADYVTRPLISFSDSLPPKKYFGIAATLLNHAQTTYDYYMRYMGHKGYDGKGNVLSIGYYDQLLNGGANAYWTSDYKIICFTVPDKSNDFTYGLDVFAHEYTHAVISEVVKGGLTYKGETGALNESYADIIGNLIEGKIRTSAAHEWEIGEDCGVGGKYGAIRSMSNPENYGDPKNYLDFRFKKSDKGGVHTNSGIFNYAFYKMATSEEGKKIPLTTWANLYYRSLYRLTSSSKFLDARYAILA